MATVEIGRQQMGILSALIRCTAAFDQSGNPALSIPWHHKGCRAPVSIQLVGPLNGDLNLLAFAGEMQELKRRACGKLNVSSEV
jgi:Asp-tRNA(Asn)/Glu-tRNA(Gln) amidotransferase A subunit family amidase